MIERTFNEFEYKRLINNFFLEVEDDIKILKGEMYSKNPNLLIQLMSERNHLDPLSAEAVRRKYESEYCPSTLFKHFNMSERFNYLILRNRIDKLLNIEWTIYNL